MKEDYAQFFKTFIARQPFDRARLLNDKTWKLIEEQQNEIGFDMVLIGLINNHSGAACDILEKYPAWIPKYLNRCWKLDCIREALRKENYPPKSMKQFIRVLFQCLEEKEHVLNAAAAQTEQHTSECSSEYSIPGPQS